MSNIILSDKRQLIPRWHTSRKLVRHAYKNTVQDQKPIDLAIDERLDKSICEWLNNKKLSNAVDLYTRLKLLHQTEHKYYRETLSFLEASKKSSSLQIKRIISDNLVLLDKEANYTTKFNHVYDIIARLKKQVRLFENDPMSWMDLAFYYSVLNDKDKARRCATVSYNLSKKNPYICRSYSRFLVDDGRPEEALYILRKSGLLFDHPLFMSAYVAINDYYNLKINILSKAKKLIKSSRINPQYISDLLSSLATIEIESGSVKKGKELLKQSLISPTENSIAQASWLNYKHGINTSRNEQANIFSIESSATNYYMQKKFKECSEVLLDLYSFQPINDGALVDFGYISIMGANNPEIVSQVSENRIPIERMTFGELNNLVVSKMLIKNYSNLERDIKYLRSKVNTKNINDAALYSATAGMYMFSIGAIDEGLNLYKEAINTYKNNNNKSSEAIAKVFLAEQLILAPETSGSKNEINNIKGLLKDSKAIAVSQKRYEISHKIDSLEKIM